MNRLDLENDTIYQLHHIMTPEKKSKLPKLPFTYTLEKSGFLSCNHPTFPFSGICPDLYWQLIQYLKTLPVFFNRMLIKDFSDYFVYKTKPSQVHDEDRETKGDLDQFFSSITGYGRKYQYACRVVENAQIHCQELYRRLLQDIPQGDFLDYRKVSDGLQHELPIAFFPYEKQPKEVLV